MAQSSHKINRTIVDFCQIMSKIVNRSSSQFNKKSTRKEKKREFNH